MKTMLAVAATVLALAAGEAAAEDRHSVRLSGSAPTAEDWAAKAFVLDLWLTRGEGPFQQTVEGWYAALPPGAGSGEAKGT
jgi:hypothetical protein